MQDPIFLVKNPESFHHLYTTTHHPLMIIFYLGYFELSYTRLGLKWFQGQKISPSVDSGGSIIVKLIIGGCCLPGVKKGGLEEGRCLVLFTPPPPG